MPAPTPLPRIHEHFVDLAQQERAVRLGMWVFLASETLLFAGLFGLWGSYYAAHPVGFTEAARHNTLGLGTANTFVLVTSSLLAALGLWAMARDRRRLSLGMVLGTAGLGVAFLAIKLVEYAKHAEEGLMPGRLMTAPQLADHVGASLFYLLYWIMTMIHALHLTAAIVLMLWLAVRIRRGRENVHDHARLEVCTLYWHLVDVMWLFLWPLLYLIR